MSKLPQVNGDRLLRALQKDGWEVKRTRGSHHVLSHPDKAQFVHVAVHARALKRGTLAAILKEAGITPERLKELM